MATAELLVPVSDTSTIRSTIHDAVADVERGEIHLVVALSAETVTPEGDREFRRAQRLLERARVWAEESIGSADIQIHRDVIGGEMYLFAPEDYAAAFGTYATEHDLETVVVDPEFWVDSVGPMLAAFEADLEAHGLDVREAAVSRPARHERIAATTSPAKLSALFVISYAFYLVLGDPTYWFDLVTGAVVATLVALMLGHVTFGREPSFPGSVYRTMRFVFYVPYLLVEIVKANIVIAMVILHPRLPIDPRMTRMHAKVGGGLPLLALANSITLTPGTLTVRANDQRLLVHTLVPAARADLFDGRLERAVRFVFYGRAFAPIATPAERGDAELIEGGETE